MLETSLLLAVFVTCIAGSWLSIQSRDAIIPMYYTCISGIVMTIAWMILAKQTKINIVVMSAWVDVAAAMGYFVGFAIMGESISLIQWAGITLLLLGLLLI